MLQIVNHGGHCCGVKHIFGFPYNPTYNTPALTQCPVSHGASAEMDPGARFVPGPYPMEPGGVRLDKLLAYIDKLKPKHLVEVVLGGSLNTNWREFLEERGFKLVTPDGFINSNTSATLFVYHRITPLPVKKEEKVVEKKVAKAAPLRAPVLRPRRANLALGSDCGNPECELCYPR